MTFAFAEFWVSMTLQCTLLLSLVAWLSRRETNSVIRDHLWSSCYLLILVLWTIGFLFPHLRLLPDPDLLSLNKPVAGVEVLERILQLIGIVWVAGVALLSIGLVISLLQTSQIVRKSSPWNSGIEDCEVCLREFGVETRTTPLALVPFCWQFHRPIIVIPQCMLDYPESELRAILRHELGHLVSRHPFQLFLQRLAEILFWYLPYMWKCSEMAAMQRELVADAWAVRNKEDAGALLQGLLRLSEQPMGKTPRMPSGLSFAGHGSLLQHRVDSLLRLVSARPAKSSRAGRSLILLCIAAIGLGIIWLPVNPYASHRSLVSPWPKVSASALKGMGISVRDFEIDNHRLHEHPHSTNSTPKSLPSNGLNQRTAF
ncbi:MAG: M56 family metallopeptidase [Planctomyces sp.]|nr:M56 family metallopeptidase [Planctomyces sp.]